jgi:hypothetical protein
MKTEPTTWELFTAKMVALGIDPLGLPIDEDDPRFDEVQALLAEFGGVAPLPPLPPHWEGHRPVDYDGTVAGIGRWLDFEWRQIIAQGTFHNRRKCTSARVSAWPSPVFALAEGSAAATAMPNACWQAKRGYCKRRHFTFQAVSFEQSTRSPCPIL